MDVQRVQTLRSIAGDLVQLELNDLNLLLFEADLEEIDQQSWYGDDFWQPSPDQRLTTVLQRIRNLSLSDLRDFSEALRILFDHATLNPPEASGPLVIFASHLSEQRALVGQVGGELRNWGVQLFVAHDSIEPDQEWQVEIEQTLSRCHAGVAFLFPNFVCSQWCDQEVGWLLGRGVPCLALKFQGQDPYGPLGRKQALPVADSLTATQIAESILDWLSTKPELKCHLNSSLVQALKSSWNFRRTDQVWARLCSAEGLPAAEVAGLLAAARDNDQVYKASGGFGSDAGPYKELVLRLALRQPGFEANMDLAWEVARVRDMTQILVDAGYESPDRGHDDATPF